MFKAIYRGENGSMGLQNGNPYTLTCKTALMGKGFSISIEGGIKKEYSDLASFISDWSEIQLAR